MSSNLRLKGEWVFALGSLLAAGVGVIALAEETPSQTIAGSVTYKTYCAVCHGVDAKGDGPLAESLRFRPPDLTLLAKRAGGTYPAETVFRIIDGRKPVKGHGGPDMPVWGDAFKNAAEGYSDEGVKKKIEGLVEFLKGIQAPAK